MAFKVKARVLLELGAELISSDGIALYELIKNAIDAASAKIEVRIAVALTSSGYRALLLDLEVLDDDRVTQKFLDENLARYFDPSTSDELKAEFVERLSGATSEAAKKRARTFFLTHSYIEIEDWGHGMSKEDLEERFLTIGTSHRARARKTSPRSAAPILGEKGIGRLSAMRLGSVLELTTSRVNLPNWAKLSVDWSGLVGDLDSDLDAFQVMAEEGAKKDSPRVHGTRIRISDLRNDWSRERVNEIARNELSKLQNPFDRQAARLDLRFSFNGVKLENAIQEIDTTWLEGWHGYFHIKFDYKVVNGALRPALTGNVKYRVKQKGAVVEEKEGLDEHDISAVGIAGYSPIAEPNQPLVKGGIIATSPRFAGIDSLGPFEATGHWFNRQRKKEELNTEKYGQFKEWLTQWGGGLLMYRDGFRVYPYADPDDDWLELDQKALRRKSFKLNRGQFVGDVRITSRGNPQLVDQTNRQGLIETPEKRRLVQCLQYVIWDELGSLVKKHEVKDAKRALSSVQEIDRQVKQKSKDARGTLRELASRAPKEGPLVQQLRDYIDELEVAWNKAKSTLKQQQQQADVYLHLAGVGMLVEFIIHEMTRVTQATLGDLKNVSGKDLTPSFKSLFAQLKTLDKRLRILDPISTPGRQRRQVASIPSIIQTLLDAHEEQFERHQIKIQWVGDSAKVKLEANVVVGQIYQIFENLITNSVYWLGHQRAVLAESRKTKSAYTPTISIEIDRTTRSIIFQDNGPGIDPADSKKIFEPFFSKKPAGRGIGLYIVKNLCEENKIQISLVEEDSREVHPGFNFTFP